MAEKKVIEKAEPDNVWVFPFVVGAPQLAIGAVVLCASLETGDLGFYLLSIMLILAGALWVRIAYKSRRRGAEE